MGSTVIPFIADAVIGFADTVLIRRGRSIDNIFPDVAIEERHLDELEITSHPVEQGAAISDHAFKRPVELIMRVGWSNSSSFATFFTGSVRDIYQQLLDLQARREPFDVVTGKRAYSNMLLRALLVTTDKDSENTLMVEASFQEVIVVNTQTALLAPIASQALPQKTASPVNTGTVQPKQVNQSILSTIFGG